MAQSFIGRKRLRKYYGKIREVLDMPNLIEVQKSSYDLFLNSGDQGSPLDGEGIQGVFQSVFPIKDFNETSITYSAYDPSTGDDSGFKFAGNIRLYDTSLFFEQVGGATATPA